MYILIATIRYSVLKENFRVNVSQSIDICHTMYIYFEFVASVVWTVLIQASELLDHISFSSSIIYQNRTVGEISNYCYINGRKSVFIDDVIFYPYEYSSPVRKKMLRSDYSVENTPHVPVGNRSA